MNGKAPLKIDHCDIGSYPLWHTNMANGFTHHYHLGESSL